MMQPVMCFVSENTGIHFRGQPVGLTCLAVAVVLPKRLHLQCGFIDQLLGELQALFGLIHIEPCQGRITAHHALFIIEHRAVRVGVELLTNALQASFLGARKVLTQADRKLRKVIAAGAEGFRRTDRQLFEPTGELRISCTVTTSSKKVVADTLRGGLFRPSS